MVQKVDVLFQVCLHDPFCLIGRATINGLTQIAVLLERELTQKVFKQQLLEITLILKDIPLGLRERILTRKEGLLQQLQYTHTLKVIQLGRQAPHLTQKVQVQQSVRCGA